MTEPPDDGTLLTFRLPRHVPRAAPGNDVDVEVSGCVPETVQRVKEVWLLEDDKRQTSLLLSVFARDGLQASAFSRGEDLLDALDALDAQDCGQGRIVFLDITIRGGLGGLDVCEALRKRLPLAKIFLVSGYSDQWESRRVDLVDLRIGFLAKPYRLSALRSKYFSPDHSVVTEDAL